MWFCERYSCLSRPLIEPVCGSYAPMYIMAPANKWLASGVNFLFCIIIIVCVVLMGFESG